MGSIGFIGDMGFIPDIGSIGFIVNCLVKLAGSHRNEPVPNFERIQTSSKRRVGISIKPIIEAVTTATKAAGLAI
jgi:hypothetical protein